MLRHQRHDFAPYVRVLLIHFLINHKVISEQNEEGYREICDRIREREGHIALADQVGKAVA
jgi:hypothetical protein